MTRKILQMVKALKASSLAAGLLILCCNPSFSQNDKLVLTLDDVISIAQERSPDALIAKHRFRSSYWAYRSYKAKYLPQVKLDAVIPNIAREYRQIPVLDGPDVFQYNNIANYQARLQVDQKIGFTGGSVFLRSSLQRLDNYYQDSTLTTWQSIPVIVGYSQPLFQYNEYKWDKKLEPLRYEKAKRRYLEDTEQVSISAVNYFFNLLLAQIEQEISIKNLYNYDTLFKIAQGRYNLGKIAENELLQLELNYLKARSAVDLSKLNYENRLFRLKSYLRLKDQRHIELIPPSHTPYQTINAIQAIEEAKKNTATSMEFKERLLTAESNVNRAKMDGRFDANLYLEYGLTQSAYDIRDTYVDPKDQQVLSLGLSVPILDWGVAKGQIKVAESNQELEMTVVEQEIIDFEQSIFLKVMQFNMQEDQLQIAAKADTVAQKRFDITQKRYMIGQVNDVLELNNAQIDNDNAKQAYYQTLRTYWNNYFELRKFTLYDFLNNQMLIFDIREVM